MKLLYYIYDNSTAQVRWNHCLSKCIAILKGTRQGGISSPFLFNIFYQDLVEDLSRTVGGINIGNCSYTTFYYEGPKGGGGSVYGFTKKIKPIYGLRR